MRCCSECSLVLIMLFYMFVLLKLFREVSNFSSSNYVLLVLVHCVDHKLYFLQD
uniref:Uncharacterized protein n=1 Tax=Arundo donax TaxID=35708 RepID=A0A0A8Z6G7_ARUDO